METKITNEDGAFVVHVRREFSTMEDAQRYAATVQFGGEKVAYFDLCVSATSNFEARAEREGGHLHGGGAPLRRDAAQRLPNLCQQ